MGIAAISAVVCEIIHRLLPVLLLSTSLPMEIRAFQSVLGPFCTASTRPRPEGYSHIGMRDISVLVRQGVICMNSGTRVHLPIELVRAVQIYISQSFFGCISVKGGARAQIDSIASIIAELFLYSA